MSGHFLLLLLVAATAAPLPEDNATSCDVLVLGAGLAGLSAAWTLVTDDRGHVLETAPKVCVVEASERVGGRTFDHTIEGCDGTAQTVELGAQWIAQEDIDSDVWDLAVNVLGLGVHNGWPWALYGFPVGPAERDPAVEARLGASVPLATDANGAEFFFGPDVPDDDPQANASCRAAVAAVYDSVVLDAPWETPGAAALDATTPLAWLASCGCNITKEDVVAQGLNQVDAADPVALPPAFWVSMTSASSSGQEIFWRASALWWLRSVKSNAGPLAMAVDLQRYRIVGGPQQMSKRLAKMLVSRGGASVDLSAPVARVEYGDVDGDGVAFVTTAGRRFVGRFAIVTGTPVALSAHVTWDPPLHGAPARMLSSARIGGYNKHYAFYDAPVWRDDPAMWAEIQRRTVQWPMTYAALPPLPPDSPYMPNGTDFFPSYIVDNSPATVASGGDDAASGGCAAPRGALFSFGWPDPDAPTAAARADGWYDLLSDVPGLGAPSSVVGQAWSEEPFVLGAYGAWWPPAGVLANATAPWNAPLPGGRVFFAGTEWSDKGSGYMNGAVHNGRKHGAIVAELLVSERRAAAP